MSSEWISPDSESEEYTRIARLEPIEGDVASFSVDDLPTDTEEEFRRSAVTEGYCSEGQVPEEYSAMDIFQVVPPGCGEITISSYEHFTGRVEGEEYTLDLQFDPELNADYQEFLNEL